MQWLICAGLDDLRNWGIQTIGILSQPEEDGTNIRGTVNLPNHSVVEFTLVGHCPYPLPLCLHSY